MEAIIAKLVDAFERGRLSRRELIQGLAVAATGGQALAAAAPAGASMVPIVSAAPFKTAGLDHISYAVADYGKSRDFYVDLMGWEVRDDNGESEATLSIGDLGTIIIRKSRQPMSLPSGEGRPPITGVINHVSWHLEEFDTDAVRAELERRGLNPRRDQGSDNDGYDSYHVLDPDGWDLQISNKRARATR